MSILISGAILKQVQDELAHSSKSLLIISAFCKLTFVEFIDDCLGDRKLKKKLIVRFRPEDIISGASDLSIFPYCKSHDWDLYFRLDLHAKTYVFDKLRCIVGSANATSSGMNLGGVGNYEMATACQLNEKDALNLEKLLLSSVKMDDTIYDHMQSALLQSGVTSAITQWPMTITDLFLPDFSVLFAEDFPTCNTPNDLTFDERLFLNLEEDATLSSIKESFTSSKCYQWLLHLLKERPEHEIYFGALTANLHNVLLDDPKPYRKDVKVLLANLLNWIQVLGMSEIIIDRPNHSQRIRLNTQNNGV